jgi:hypothetical protein
MPRSIPQTRGIFWESQLSMTWRVDPIFRPVAKAMQCTKNGERFQGRQSEQRKWRRKVANTTTLLGGRDGDSNLGV